MENFQELAERLHGNTIRLTGLLERICKGSVSHEDAICELVEILSEETAVLKDIQAAETET